MSEGQIDELVPPARTPGEAAERQAANREAWNQGAAHYTALVDETIEFIRAGKSNLSAVERQNLGDLAPWCEVAIHLQCASGRDTLSLLNEGARRVVGVDISDVMIENARRTSDALGAPTTWYRCDVFDTPHELDGTADLVYTGRGALNWIQDIDRWATVVERLLKPGGVLSLFEEHPFAWFFDTEATELKLYPGVHYFGQGWASQGWPATYIGDLEIPVEQQAVKYDRLWPLSSVFGALRRVGLNIEILGEYPEDYWDSFANLKDEYRGRIPTTYSLVARKPR